MEETLTGGGCVGDYDGDGIDDLYYPRMDGSDFLYRNRGDGTFADVTFASGIGAFADLRSNGCLFVDIDNDGDNDIYISTLGDKRFYLFVNDGAGHFSEEAEKRGLANVKTGNYPLTAGFTLAAGPSCTTTTESPGFGPGPSHGCRPDMRVWLSLCLCDGTTPS